MDQVQWIMENRWTMVDERMDNGQWQMREWTMVDEGMDNGQ